jgi:hypothetical protein
MPRPIPGCEAAVPRFSDVPSRCSRAPTSAARIAARQAGIAFDHAVLDFDGAAHGVDYAAKLDQNAVAGAFDDASMMGVDGGIDQIAAQPPQPRQCAILVRSRKTAIADDVRNQNRRYFARFPHGAPSERHSK